MSYIASELKLETAAYRYLFRRPSDISVSANFKEEALFNVRRFGVHVVMLREHFVNSLVLFMSASAIRRSS